MRSLFLKMFLWFGAANAVSVSVILAGYLFANPDQVPFGWPSVGRGAIVSAARMAVAAWGRGGQVELVGYLESLERDAGLQASLFDASGHESSGRGSIQGVPPELSSYAEGQLMLRSGDRLSGLRLRSENGASYVFLANLPGRDGRGLWYRALIVSFVLTGALLCYLLARQVTAPIIDLRHLTSGFARGDLTARVTSGKVLARRDEIGGLAVDFNQMAARIETLLTSQRRLLADVSHELRSPLTRLGLALGLLRRDRDGLSPPSLARIEREVERLNALVAQLLTLSSLESLDQPPPMDSIDLNALVREIVVDADFEAISMNRSVHLEECGSCAVRGAPDLLRSAVENIVRNALKYTVPDSQVLIRLIRSGVNGDGTATIVVEDQGPGVPPAALEHLFEPFYRVDEARDRRSGGVGLGLAIARRIVTLHGGSVVAANRAAGGLEMRLTLPVS